MAAFRDKLRPYKRAIQHLMSGSQNDFERATLPWIDQPNANVDAFVEQFPVPDDFPYDLTEKLNFWRENGYVILEQAIPTEWCDKLWAEIEDTIDNHEQFRIESLVDGVNNNRNIAIRDVPKEKLREIGARLNDYHQASLTCKRVLSHKRIATFLQAIFNEPVVAFQTLVFKYGSQQGVHQDFPWVTSGIPSHLAAAWIALEDITADAGPLFYYPGSHKMKKFNFGNGILYKEGESLRSPNDFAKYIEQTCGQSDVEKDVLLLKKGDLLIWHAALAHGGLAITSQPAKTRKSLVVHYSTRRAYPTHLRFGSRETDAEYVNNGIAMYRHPQRPDEENVLRTGEDWVE